MPGRDQSQIIGGPNLDIYSAPYDEARAFITDSAYNFSSGWGDDWIHRGYTRDGLRLRWTRQWDEWTVDQEVVPVLRTPGSFDLRMGANLAQMDLSNFAAAVQQGTVTTTAAASGTRGHIEYVVPSDMNLAYVATGFEMKNPSDGEGVRFIGYRGLPLGDIDLNLARRPPGTQINFEVALVPDPSFTPARLFIARDIIPALP